MTHPGSLITPLVAPYCVIPRDYLSETPLLRAMGLLVSQHGQLGTIPPPPSPFSERFPWRACEAEVRYPPPQKGYLSDTCVIPYENKANGCDTPLCDTISKGYCAIWGGISHWAAKITPHPTQISQHCPPVHVSDADMLSNQCPSASSTSQVMNQRGDGIFVLLPSSFSDPGVITHKLLQNLSQNEGPQGWRPQAFILSWLAGPVCYKK